MSDTYTLSCTNSLSSGSSILIVVVFCQGGGESDHEDARLSVDDPHRKLDIDLEKYDCS